MNEESWGREGRGGSSVHGDRQEGSEDWKKGEENKAREEKLKPEIRYPKKKIMKGKTEKINGDLR